MPKFSIIVPTYNRAHLITYSINSLLAQTYHNVEIIVIDDGSTDKTKDILKPYMDRIKYCYQNNEGISSARNHGIKEATGEYIAFTDDDVIAEPDWLANIDKCFSENRCDAVGGMVLPIYNKNTPSWIKKDPIKISGGVVMYDYGKETFRLDPSMHCFIGCNFAFHREVFNECGNFRTDIRFKGRLALGEDTEFIQRLINKGKVLYYCGRALIHHPVDNHRLTLRHCARWNKALGQFTARNEHDNHKNHYVYCYGVPRYLFKGIIIDFFKIIISFYDRLSLHLAFRSFFRKMGMIAEYRLIYKERKLK